MFFVFVLYDHFLVLTIFLYTILMLFSLSFFGHCQFFCSRFFQFIFYFCWPNNMGIVEWLDNIYLLQSSIVQMRVCKYYRLMVQKCIWKGSHVLPYICVWNSNIQYLFWTQYNTHGNIYKGSIHTERKKIYKRTI